MSAIETLQSRRFYKIRLVTSSLIAIAWCGEAVAQTASVAPPTRYILDENGVNMATRAVITPRVDVSIGPNEDPFQYISYNSNLTNVQMDLYISGGGFLSLPTASAMVMAPTARDQFHSISSELPTHLSWGMDRR